MDITRRKYADDVPLIKDCTCCIYFQDLKNLNGWYDGYRCTKGEVFPNCSFKHFYHTWSKGLQKDVFDLISAGEQIEGFTILGGKKEEEVEHEPRNNERNCLAAATFFRCFG